MDTKQFTLLDGLNIQMQQLLVWKGKLNQECFDSLMGYAARCNETLAPDATGFDVVRGGDLDRYVANWKPSVEESMLQIADRNYLLSDLQQAIYGFAKSNETPSA